MTATVAYLRDFHADAQVFPIVGESVVDQLEAADFDVVDEWEAADVVVAGFDEDFDYDDMTDGLRAMHAGTPLIGVDPDRWVPTEDGPIPGSGAVVNAVAGAAQREPEAILGKPSPVTANIALQRLGVAPSSCLMVGDRLDTDIEMGRRAGMQTAVVLTGASTRAEIEASEHPPDVVLEHLGWIERVLS